ncbi:MAG: glycosyltransferase [Pricia sp.]
MLHAEKINYFDTADIALLDDLALIMGDKCGPIDPEVKVIVTIPAKNEEDGIYKSLRSLALQTDLYGKKVAPGLYHILVLCHDCSDGTMDECMDFSIEHPDIGISVLEVRDPVVNNVGAVRRIGMQIAQSKIPDSRGFIAMTDADTIVHPKWISNLLGYLNSDYDLICGKILTKGEPLDRTVEQVLAMKKTYNTYRLELENTLAPIPWDVFPKHCDNSGPNMAVRADVYEEVGGMHPLGFCEDINFYDTVIWQGHKVRHCPMTVVTTSTRTLARTPWGFGAEIGLWRQGGADSVKVEGLAALLARYSINGLLKAHIGAPQVATRMAIMELSGIGAVQLQEYVDTYTTWYAVVHKIEKHLDGCKEWRKRFPLVPIREACRQLAAYLAST